jgi:hypothetical protein
VCFLILVSAVSFITLANFISDTFNYLGYNISYEGEKDLNIKAANFVKVLGIIN